MKNSLCRDSLTFSIPPGEYRKQPEYTGKCPNYTSGGAEFILLRGDATMRIRPDVLQVLQFLTPCSRFPVFFTSKILLVWFLCLTKVVSTNMVTAELIRFVWFYTWPRWSALLGLLNNHFDFVIFVLGQVGQHQYGFRRINSFCVILCLTKVVNVDRVAAELIVLCEFCTWLRWSTLIGLLQN